MEIFLFGTPLLLLVIVLIHLLVRNRQKDRAIAGNAKKIEELMRQVDGLKKRHLTAKGGLGQGEKLKLLDLLAKIGMLKDDANLVNLRIEDLEREVIKILNEKKTGDKL